MGFRLRYPGSHRNCQQVPRLQDCPIEPGEVFSFDRLTLERFLDRQDDVGVSGLHEQLRHLASIHPGDSPSLDHNGFLPSDPRGDIA
jgi:hypothetical protein